MEELRDVLLPIAVLGSFGAALVFFTKVLTDYLLRKKLVEKGLVGPDVAPLLQKQVMENNKLNSLKWGIIIFFGGAGLIVIDLIDYEANSTVPFGIFACMLSLGFLVYFLVARMINKD
jgi:hypothetical protein